MFIRKTESLTIHLERRETGRRKWETKTTISRFRETRYLLSLALLFALSERLLLARKDRSKSDESENRPRKPALRNWRRFSLEIIMSRCFCGRRCWRNEIIAEREDTNKYGSSFNPKTRWGWALTFNHQGRNFLVPLRRYKLIIRVLVHREGDYSYLGYCDQSWSLAVIQSLLETL